MDRSLATEIVDRHGPARTVTAVEPVRAGHRPTAVVRFETHPPVVVQCSEAIEAVRTEAALVRAVRDRTEVPVAPVRATGRYDGQAYAINEFRPGTDLHTTFADSQPTVQRGIATQFGRYLGQLHAAFPFGSCGELARAADDSLVAPDGDAHGWLVAYGWRAVERLPPAFDPLRERLSDCLGTVTAGEVTPRLFPWDLRPGNALATDGGVTAVLDWERPMAAPPALAVAKTEYLVADWYVDEPAPLRGTFREGYESVRPLPAVEAVHRLVAIADSAVDSRGDVTNPGYPEVSRQDAVDFHRTGLEAAVRGDPPSS